MARYILEDQNVDVDFLLGIKTHWECQGTTTPFHVLLSLRPTDIEVDNLFMLLQLGIMDDSVVALVHELQKRHSLKA